ncbi:Uncharacterised protein [uncultured archaeon]|nr:Uncharacterised protein [uncultured archaeon]
MVAGCEADMALLPPVQEFERVDQEGLKGTGMKLLKLKHNGEAGIQPMTQPSKEEKNPEIIFRLTIKRGSIQVQVDLTVDEAMDLLEPVLQYTNK